MSAKFQERQEKDLFGQFQGTEKRVAKKTRFLIPRIRDSVIISYENIVFLSIGLLMFCVICFSLGVEKGRRDTGREKPIGRVTIFEPESNQRQEIRVKGQGSKNTAAIVNEPPAATGGYIVQLAAFKNKAPAEKELDRLRRDGYTAADVKKSGEYFQLYVGGFAKRSEADRLKEKLKARYPDCYTRPL